MSDRRTLDSKGRTLTPWGPERPESWALRRESWAFFATLTFADRPAPGVSFKGSIPKKVIRQCTPVFNWLRLAAKATSVRWQDMAWAFRLEPGELNAREHYHCLIGGIPGAKVHNRTCGVLSTLWRHSLGYGIADVRVWDGRDAVGYLLKSSSEWSFVGANGYELGKFNSAERVVLGQAFVEKWRQLLHSDNSANKAFQLPPVIVSPGNPDWTPTDSKPGEALARHVTKGRETGQGTGVRSS